MASSQVNGGSCDGNQDGGKVTGRQLCIGDGGTGVIKQQPFWHSEVQAGLAEWACLHVSSFLDHHFGFLSALQSALGAMCRGKLGFFVKWSPGCIRSCQATATVTSPAAGFALQMCDRSLSDIRKAAHQIVDI